MSTLIYEMGWEGLQGLPAAFAAAAAAAVGGPKITAPPVEGAAATADLLMCLANGSGTSCDLRIARKVSSKNIPVLLGSCGPGTTANISMFDEPPVQCLHVAIDRAGRGG